MAVSKVNYAGETLIDLTSDTVTPETLDEGVTAHAANGEQITGTRSVAASMPLSGGTFTGPAYAGASAQAPGSYLLRNQKVSLTAENPTVNGEICWLAE